jgi:hypothetical protein
MSSSRTETNVAAAPGRLTHTFLIPILPEFGEPWDDCVAGVYNTVEGGRVVEYDEFCCSLSATGEGLSILSGLGSWRTSSGFSSMEGGTASVQVLLSRVFNSLDPMLFEPEVGGLSPITA